MGNWKVNNSSAAKNGKIYSVFLFPLSYPIPSYSKKEFSFPLFLINLLLNAFIFIICWTSHIKMKRDFPSSTFSSLCVTALWCVSFILYILSDKWRWVLFFVEFGMPYHLLNTTTSEKIRSNNNEPAQDTGDVYLCITEPTTNYRSEAAHISLTHKK